MVMVDGYQPVTQEVKGQKELPWKTLFGRLKNLKLKKKKFEQSKSAFLFMSLLSPSNQI